MKFAHKKSHHINAMNFMLFVSGLALVTSFLAILTVTSIQRPTEPEQISSPMQGETQQVNITAEVVPVISVEVIP